jgi:hypothetical protein
MSFFLVLLKSVIMFVSMLMMSSFFCVDSFCLCLTV